MMSKITSLIFDEIIFSAFTDKCGEKWLIILLEVAFIRVIILSLFNIASPIPRAKYKILRNIFINESYIS